MNGPAFLLKTHGPAIRTKATPKHSSNPSNYKSIFNLLTATPPLQSAKPYSSPKPHHTGTDFQQPNSEAYEAEDRCLRVSSARRLMLPHPAAPQPFRHCHSLLQQKRNLADMWRTRGRLWIDRWPAAVARCLADVIQTHKGTKVYIE